MTRKLSLILGAAAVCAVALLAVEPTVTDTSKLPTGTDARSIPRFRYKWVGADKNVGRFGLVSSNDTVVVSEREAITFNGDTNWTALDYVVAPVLAAGTNVVMTTNSSGVVAINATGSSEGGAPAGTVVNSGTPVSGAVPSYSGTTGTNLVPGTALSQSSTNAAVAGDLTLNSLTATNTIELQTKATNSYAQKYNVYQHVATNNFAIVEPDVITQRGINITAVGAQVNTNLFAQQEVWESQWHNASNIGVGEYYQVITYPKSTNNAVRWLSADAQFDYPGYTNMAMAINLQGDTIRVRDFTGLNTPWLLTVSSNQATQTIYGQLAIRPGTASSSVLTMYGGGGGSATINMASPNSASTMVLEESNTEFALYHNGTAKPMHLYSPNVSKVQFDQMIMFGGTSSSFPGVTNSGATLEVKKADNSGYTPIKAGGVGSVDTTAAVSIATGGWTNTFTGNAMVRADGTGITYTVYNSAGTATYTNAATVTHFSEPIQSSGKVLITAGSGIIGTAAPW